MSRGLQSSLPFACVLAAVALLAPGMAQSPTPGIGRGGPPARNAGPPVRTITQVTRNLYKVTNGSGIGATVTVFLVTSDGIVLADPINPEFSSWLKGELATRFPGKPVKWVIESHYHWDHARGGAMFADTATFIAQENMRTNLRLPIAQAPPPGDATDHDGDNRLDRREATGGTRGNFDRLDSDHDGFISHDELVADVRWPDVVFKDQYTITLGGQNVQLIWAKNRHTSDLLDIYFPGERVLFVGDYVWVNRVCCGFAFDHRPMATWIASIKALEPLDFDVMIASHWDQGTKADMIAFRQWLEDLQSAVAAGIQAGKPVAELQKTIRLDKYKSWTGYDTQLPDMIRSAYDSLTIYSAK
jgi:glyoxylase-like metal-dependent hydrolase (beta-lactamase superfamily II)